MFFPSLSSLPSISAIQLDAPTATVISAVVAAGVAGLVAFFTQWFARRDERRRQFRQLAFQAALENWRHQNQLKIDLLKAGAKGDFVIDAPDDYIIHMLLVMEIASNLKLTARQAADLIATKGRNPDSKPK